MREQSIDCACPVACFDFFDDNLHVAALSETEHLLSVAIEIAESLNEIVRKFYIAVGIGGPGVGHVAFVSIYPDLILLQRS
jgi:hypothetical protein